MGARQSSLTFRYEEYTTLIAYRRVLDAIDPELVQSILQKAIYLRKASAVADISKLKDDVKNVVALQGGSKDEIVAIQSPQEMYTTFSRTGRVNSIQISTVLKLLLLFFVMMPVSALETATSRYIAHGIQKWGVQEVPIKDFGAYRVEGRHHLDFVRVDPAFVQECIALHAGYLQIPLTNGTFREVGALLTVNRDGILGLKAPDTQTMAESLTVNVGDKISVKHFTGVAAHDVPFHSHPPSPGGTWLKSLPSENDLLGFLYEVILTQTRFDVIAAPEGLYVVHVHPYWHGMAAAQSVEKINFLTRIDQKLTREDAYSFVYKFPLKDKMGNEKDLIFQVDRYRYSSLLSGTPIKLLLPVDWIKSSTTTVRSPALFAREALDAMHRQLPPKGETLARWTSSGPTPSLLDVVLDQPLSQTRISISSVQAVEDYGKQQSPVPEFNIPYKA
jgi:hypothetical protein